jgi:hypothetical protein
MIRFLTFEMIHGKRSVGSTRLRVHNLIKYWPEAAIYKYGENPDVMIFQKVYTTQDYKFHKHFEGIKILDICDPDWLDGMPIKETIDVVDGITCPTEALADFMRQLTDKPIKIIPDRHDPQGLLERRIHSGIATRAIWFGYKQNAELLKFAIPSLERLNLSLMIVSNDDPQAWRWAMEPELYRSSYFYTKYDEDEIMNQLREADICILPPGNRPIDRFKSNNKTTKAWLAGTPVAVDGEQLRNLVNPEVRNAEAEAQYKTAKLEYNCKKSIEDLKEFIEQLKRVRNEKI